MSKVLAQLFSVSGIGARHDDDFTDRMVSRYSTTIFITLCLVVTTTQYVGSPIECWMPQESSGDRAKYINAMCLISPTYMVRFTEEIPRDPQHHINFYVWVPFILLCCALLCFLPSIIWKGLYKGVGFNVPSILERLQNSQSLSRDKRADAITYVADHIDRYTQCYAMKCCRGKNSNWFCLGKRSGNYLTTCYLCIKFLYAAISVGLIFILSWFLDTDFHWYGMEVFLGLLSGDQVHQLERFPLVTMCDIKVFHMNQVHKYVVQCALPINLFNEKIFLFVWFWLIILACCTIFSLLKWTYKSLIWYPQIAYIRQCLRTMRVEKTKNMREQTEEFTCKLVRRDSLFLLRLMAHNVGVLTTSEVVTTLWRRYYGSDLGPPAIAPTLSPSCPTAASQDEGGFREVVTHALNHRS